jgi:histidyl-tRNA synthetase
MLIVIGHKSLSLDELHSSAV